LASRFGSQDLSKAREHLLEIQIGQVIFPELALQRRKHPQNNAIVSGVAWAEYDLRKKHLLIEARPAATTVHTEGIAAGTPALAWNIRPTARRRSPFLSGNPADKMIF
jgi:hypothetical protein